jgi:hypothetical protein
VHNLLNYCAVINLIALLYYQQSIPVKHFPKRGGNLKIPQSGNAAAWSMKYTGLVDEKGQKSNSGVYYHPLASTIAHNR